MKDLTGQLNVKQRSDSDLILAFLGVHGGLEYTRVGDMFIIWKIVDDTLEIHDVYSEEASGYAKEVIDIFIADKDVKYVETYVDKDYINGDKSDRFIRSFGGKPYKQTEEYIYYIMEK